MGYCNENKPNHRRYKRKESMKYDKKRKCPKCGGEADTRYVVDLLKRMCVECGYGWTELPLDIEDNHD